MIHISIQSLSVVRFNRMQGIENESSSRAKQKKQSIYSDYEYFDALFHDNINRDNTDNNQQLKLKHQYDNNRMHNNQLCN